MQQQILNYFNSNNLFHALQHGFRTGFSCETALHELISKLITNIENKLSNLILFIDFRKAFDYVNSDLLLMKLCNYGFSSNSLKLISNYFYDRKQITKYKDCLSQPLPICLGVPQGSILGPLFFLIFINDLLFDFDDGNIELFADDTTIFNSGVDFNSTYTSISHDVEKVINWSKYNYLEINWSKTFIMYINHNININESIPTSLHFMNKTIEISLVKQFKLLGVILDDKLNFKQNIDNICSRVHSTLFSLKSKFFLSQETKLQFFKTFILPIFDYCLSLVIYYNKELKTRLIKLYRFCLRKLLNISLCNINGENLDSAELNKYLSRFNLMCLEYRIMYRLSLFIHKININKNPPNLFNMLKYNNELNKGGYNLRNLNKLHVPVFKSKLGCRHFSMFFSKFVNILLINQFNDNFIIFKQLILKNLDNFFILFNTNIDFF